jgi:hypothetical protein
MEGGREMLFVHQDSKATAGEKSVTKGRIDKQMVLQIDKKKGKEQGMERMASVIASRRKESGE